jgi:hypothetical protein
MTKKVKVSDYLIKLAKEALEKQPSTVEEQIEKWAYIGVAASQQLNEMEIMNLQLDNCTITVVPKIEN